MLWVYFKAVEIPQSAGNGKRFNPVDTLRRFNVYKTSILSPRRCIDVL